MRTVSYLLIALLLCISAWSDFAASAEEDELLRSDAEFHILKWLQEQEQDNSAPDFGSFSLEERVALAYDCGNTLDWFIIYADASVEDRAIVYKRLITDITRLLAYLAYNPNEEGVDRFLWNCFMSGTEGWDRAWKWHQQSELRDLQRLMK